MERPQSSFNDPLSLIRYLLTALTQERSFSTAETDLLARGFEIAWFIHRDQDKAQEIAAGAFERFETVVENQSRYRDYSTPHHRTKVQLTQDQCYQHEVLRHSDEEQEKELKHLLPLNEETMLVYFFSFITVNLFRTNSFRATAAIGRLLFRLSADETRELYQILNPQDRDRGDDEYNREKMNLFKLLKDRFEEQLIPERLQRNEKSFKERLDPGDLRDLAAACWEKFAPWRNKCLLSAPGNDLTQLENLFKQGATETERERMHISLHCLGKLLQISLGQQKEPLIPQFVFASSSGDSGGSLRPRLSPPELTKSDFQKLLSKIALQRQRRRETLTPVLQCKVDGNIKTEIDLRCITSSEPIIFTDPDKRLEVWANDLLLATYYLPSLCDFEQGFILKDSITLEGGQRLTFSCSFNSGNQEQPDGSVIVHYQETGPVRLLVRQWQASWYRLCRIIFGSPQLVVQKTGPWLPRLVTITLLSIITLVLFLIWSKALRGPNPTDLGTSTQFEKRGNIPGR